MSEETPVSWLLHQPNAPRLCDKIVEDFASLILGGVEDA